MQVQPTCPYTGRKSICGEKCFLWDLMIFSISLKIITPSIASRYNPAIANSDFIVVSYTTELSNLIGYLEV